MIKSIMGISPRAPPSILSKKTGPKLFIMDFNRQKKLKPFLKWAGGKRWFTSNHDGLIPKSFNRYIEPFLGSGAIFFHLQPKVSILGDLNHELIETYKAIKDEWKKVVRHLVKHQERHCPTYYYQQRANRPKTRAQRAARFIYLNRTGWNGLYRVNRKGEYNVPIGNRSTVILEDDDFESVAQALKNARLYSGDFEKLINQAKKEDLLFVDPPYTVSHNNNGFIKYNEKLFSWSDQERLSRALARAKDRGVKILATNAYHAPLVELYRHDFSTITVTRPSMIAGKVIARNSYEELVISHNN